jgi:hypothetical protein
VFRPKPPCFSENGPQLTYAAVFFSGAPVIKICITQVHMAHMRIPVIIIAAETFMTRLLSIRISHMIILIITPFAPFVKSFRKFQRF